MRLSRRKFLTRSTWTATAVPWFLHMDDGKSGVDLLKQG